MQHVLRQSTQPVRGMAAVMSERFVTRALEEGVGDIACLMLLIESI